VSHLHPGPDRRITLRQALTATRLGLTILGQKFVPLTLPRPRRARW
jgi:hypothetical protein